VAPKVLMSDHRERKKHRRGWKKDERIPGGNRRGSGRKMRGC